MVQFAGMGLYVAVFISIYKVTNLIMTKSWHHWIVVALNINISDYQDVYKVTTFIVTNTQFLFI